MEKKTAVDCRRVSELKNGDRRLEERKQPRGAGRQKAGGAGTWWR